MIEPLLTTNLALYLKSTSEKIHILYMLLAKGITFHSSNSSNVVEQQNKKHLRKCRAIIRHGCKEEINYLKL